MRSKLFVPGSRPELFAKAFAGEADAVSLDLEDAVVPARKAQARAAVGEWLARLAAEPDTKGGKRVIVRVNAMDSGLLEADLAAVVRPGLDVVNLPKPATPQAVRQAAALLRELAERAAMPVPPALLLNIETPRALRAAADLAAADALVEGLQLGLADLFEPAAIERRERSAIEQAMFGLRMAASEAGVYAYDAAFADIADADGYRVEAGLARRLGFLGKTCIHPSQVPLANAVFVPTADEVAQAERIVVAARRAAREGAGACVVDGRMIDPPFVERAHAVLRAARQPVPAGEE